MVLLDCDVSLLEGTMTIDPNFLPTGYQSISIPDANVCFLQNTDGPKLLAK